MRKIFLSLALTLAAIIGFSASSNVAQAAEKQLIHQFTTDYLQKSYYHFDAKTGEAWFELRYLDTSADPGCYGQTPFPRPNCPSTPTVTRQTAEVQGLTFDAVASQIVFASSTGARVICATVTEGRRKWFITPTGECKVYATRGGRDGRKLSVYFEVK